MKIAHLVGWYFPDSVGGTEVYVEGLCRWLRAAGHVVLIDDMRYFTGTDGYPRAVDLVQWIRSDEPRGSVEIRDDILRWHMRMA